MNQGAVHEAMNLASVLDLGVIFLCENNGYAEYTPTEAMFRIDALADRARAYGFSGETVDGSDVHALHDVVSAAADRARRGNGPTLIDARVLRLEGHHTHDPEHYRPRGEKARWHETDPLARLRSRLVEDGHSADAVDAVEREVDRANERALESARASPLPDPRSVTQHLHG